MFCFLAGQEVPARRRLRPLVPLEVRLLLLRRPAPGASFGLMLTATTSNSLPTSKFSTLERADQPVQHLRAQHRALVIHEREDHRALAEVLAEPHVAAGLVLEHQVERHLLVAAADRCRSSSAAPAWPSRDRRLVDPARSGCACAGAAAASSAVAIASAVVRVAEEFHDPAYPFRRMADAVMSHVALLLPARMRPAALLASPARLLVPRPALRRSSVRPTPRHRRRVVPSSASRRAAGAPAGRAHEQLLGFVDRDVRDARRADPPSRSHRASSSPPSRNFASAAGSLVSELRRRPASCPAGRASGDSCGSRAAACVEHAEHAQTMTAQTTT